VIGLSGDGLTFRELEPAIGAVTATHVPSGIGWRVSYPVLVRSGVGLTFRELEAVIGARVIIDIRSDTGWGVPYPVLGRSGAVVFLGVEGANVGGTITGIGIWLTTGIAEAVDDVGICKGTLVVWAIPISSPGIIG
jgi:hypothetical protein